MNQKLASMTQTTIIESLETELKINQRKYEYHKRITQGYFELVQQTMQKLEEQRHVI